MLHALYIVAFAILAVLAVGNLIRNMMLLGKDARRAPRQSYGGSPSTSQRPAPHPELLDDTGRVIDEPLLVMRSISLQDARDRLDDLYNDRPNRTDDPTEDDA